MQLKESSLISPVIESGEILTALETAISPQAIEQAIAFDKQHKRSRHSTAPPILSKRGIPAAATLRPVG